MPKYRKYMVEPSLPEKLKPLERISYNLWWTWNPNAINLLRRIDPDLWDNSNHNPVRVLGMASQQRLRELENNEGFLTHIERVQTELDDYLNSDTWCNEQYCYSWDPKYSVAYFSFEFGLDECLPIYSGGLGVLAGDHLKSASDLGLPLVGVGLAYSRGYFKQYLNPDGWQQEGYVENNFSLLPLRLQKNGDGSALKIDVPFPGRNVIAQIWKAEVGRVPLYLLDTNIPENTPEDQAITRQLYGGDREMRLMQEILLGIGGIKALKALGVKPSACHINEGHAAFLNIERILDLMRSRGFGFYEAKAACIASTVFTTHTPVPAGHDRFDPNLLKRYLNPLMEDMDVDLNRFLALGRVNTYDENEPFCMTVFALRLSAASNGVSKLHGEVSRKMWKDIWPGVPEHLVPIGSITNGVHIRAWISEELRLLFERYLGLSWINRPGDDSIWDKIPGIPEAELWRTHERRRERLVAFVRRRLAEQLKQKGAPEYEIKLAEETLDPEAFTIGFARRFATYKRGDLILKDVKRLSEILNDKNRPVQIIFAGKAHPQDTEGKNLIKRIVHTARENGFQHKLVFIENYDIDVARYLVQGCDIWLNNPRRPFEASGTSGMKAAANGVLNVSILDGWWDEGYSPETGWAIGHGETYDDLETQDAIESKALYEILEHEVVPLFYNRGKDGLPHKWIEKMKSSMHVLLPSFNTNRMVREYTDRFYVPLGERWRKYVDEDEKIIKSLAAWKLKIKQNWAKIKIVDIQTQSGEPSVGGKIPVTAVVQIDGLSKSDLRVDCYYGVLDHHEKIRDGKTVPLSCIKENSGGEYVYSGEIPCDNAGMHGLAIRVLPYHENMVLEYLPGLILWGY